MPDRLGRVRIHRILAEACEELVRAVFDDGKVLDRVVAEAFKANPKWGRRDRGFVAESVWEVVRWRRALEFVAGSDQVKALLAAEWRRCGWEVPEWWRWEGEGLEEMAARGGALPDQARAIRESVPDWLDQQGSSELGEAWDAELAALNRRAPVFLRVNRLLATREEVRSWLSGEGVETNEVAGSPDALELSAKLPKGLVGDGRIEIQDAGSQVIAPLLDVEPGMRVVDACAGAGGKTLHLAALMENKGEILALDVGERKLHELKKRVGRAQARNVRVEAWAADTLRRRTGWADRVLIDAPCSGLGTLRRQPDLKWRLSGDSLAKMRRTQRKLLDQYGDLLKPGGKLVYATCSVLPSENRGQVGLLVERDPRWRVEEEVLISPASSGWDGFYGARLARGD